MITYTYNVQHKDGIKFEMDLNVDYYTHNTIIISNKYEYIVKDQWWNRLGRYFFPNSKKFRKKLIEL